MTHGLRIDFCLSRCPFFLLSSLRMFWNGSSSPSLPCSSCFCRSSSSLSLRALTCCFWTLHSWLLLLLLQLDQLYCWQIRLGPFALSSSSALLASSCLPFPSFCLPFPLCNIISISLTFLASASSLAAWSALLFADSSATIPESAFCSALKRALRRSRSNNSCAYFFGSRDSSNKAEKNRKDVELD